MPTYLFGENLVFPPKKEYRKEPKLRTLAALEQEFCSGCPFQFTDNGVCNKASPANVECPKNGLWEVIMYDLGEALRENTPNYIFEN